MSRLGECDAISICVPTPPSKTRDPDVSFILDATEAVAAAQKPGQLIVLESTTYPGTTREVLLPALEKTGLTVGQDFYLCFSPERVDPGKEVWQTKSRPKVIGGITETCTAAGKAFRERFVDTMVPVCSTSRCIPRIVLRAATSWRRARSLQYLQERLLHRLPQGGGAGLHARCRTPR